jgi:hypothetical protein
MKRIVIVILSLLGAMLSGCVVAPAGYYHDDGYRQSHSYYYGHSYAGQGYYSSNYSGYRGTWDHGQ